MKSKLNTQTGSAIHVFIAFLVLFAAFAMVIFIINKGADYAEKKLGFDFSGNCLAISEAAKDLSRVRGDEFVIDARKLHSFYNTRQPISFWLNSLAGKSRLTEGEDYVVIGGDGEKQWLLTIDVVRGVAAKSVESDGGFFESQESRVSKRLLACLQEPHFLKF